MAKYTEEELKEELENSEYKYGFYTDIESETFPKGLNEEVVIALSKKKNEPQWMTDWRLEAFRVWQAMEVPHHRANHKFETPDFQDIANYSAPKQNHKLNSLDEVDPQLLETFQKLGISLEEQKRLTGVEDKPAVAVDVVMDSVSVATTFQKTLAERGIIFCTIS